MLRGGSTIDDLLISLNKSGFGNINYNDKVLFQVIVTADGPNYILLDPSMEEQEDILDLATRYNYHFFFGMTSDKVIITYIKFKKQTDDELLVKFINEIVSTIFKVHPKYEFFEEPILNKIITEDNSRFIQSMAKLGEKA